MLMFTEVRRCEGRNSLIKNLPTFFIHQCIETIHQSCMSYKRSTGINEKSIKEISRE